jgi:hypothetical protein
MLCGLGLALPTPALAQGKQQPLEILVAYDALARPKASPRIALRPNVTQPVFLYLKNTGPLVKKNLDIMLVRLGNQGKVRILSNSRMEKIGANQTELVRFKPSAAPGKDGAPGKGEPALVGAEGPPFHYQLWVSEGDKETLKMELPVTIQQPLEYMQVDPVFDKKRNRLSVRVEVNPDSAEPPCPVELVLDTELIPGLIRPKIGLLKDQLVPKNREVELFADNLQFVSGIPPKNGRIALTVDGYERAYLFKSTFEQGNLRPLRDQTRVRVKAPRYFNPEEKTGPKGDKIVPQLVLHLEADGIADPDTRLEVAFDRAGNGQYAVQRLFPGLRDQSLAVAALEEGGLQFKTRVRDWTMELDTTGVFGRRLVRLRVLGAGGRPLPLADEQNQRDEALSLFSREPGQTYAALNYDGVNKAVYAEIVVDSTPPDGVLLVDLPPRAAPGEKVNLKATVKKRNDTEQAPVSRVQFFVGDPQKDPPVPGLFDKQNQLWRASVTVPADAKDKMAVTVVFTTATGLSASNTATIPLQAGGNLDDSKITGVVSWDTRLQPGKPVTLKDGKGKTLATTETDKKGVYVFASVKPGSYRVFAAIPGILRGDTPATVTKDKGETVKADISLKRIP